MKHIFINVEHILGYTLLLPIYENSLVFCAGLFYNVF